MTAIGIQARNMGTGSLATFSIPPGPATHPIVALQTSNNHAQLLRPKTRPIGVEYDHASGTVEAKWWESLFRILFASYSAHNIYCQHNHPEKSTHNNKEYTYHCIGGTTVQEMAKGNGRKVWNPLSQMAALGDARMLAKYDERVQYDERSTR